MFIWKGRQDRTAVKHDSVLFLDPCLCKNIRERKKQPRKKAIKLFHSRYPNRKALKLTANSLKRNSNNKLNRGQSTQTELRNSSLAHSPGKTPRTIHNGPSVTLCSFHAPNKLGKEATGLSSPQNIKAKLQAKPWVSGSLYYQVRKAVNI